MMFRWLLLSLSLLGAAFSSLTMVKAPTLFLWKCAILVGEFGHWLIAIPLAILTISAWRNPQHPRLRIITHLLCFWMIACLAKPHLHALMLRGEISRTLNNAFGDGTSVTSPYSIRALASAKPSPGVVETLNYTGTGETKVLRMDFYHPAKKTTARNSPKGVPCIIVIHGGGWNNGDRTQLPALNHKLASLGYAVAAIDYRLAPTHRWPAPRDDVRTAVNFLKSHAEKLGIDPERLVLLGRSAGGQIAQAVAYDQPDPGLRGVISLYGPADLNFAWYNTPEKDILNSRQLMRDYLGGSPEEQPSAYTDASPFLRVGAQSLPTLLIHGRLDSLVWFRQSERLSEKLSNAGVRHAFIALPWATHAFDYNLNGPGGQLCTHAIEHFLQNVTR